VKKLLINCDQVFDVLTRGPFPTGEPGDEAVEYHLQACFECRRLAEALRPAVELMHEAVAADQAIDLPEYQGALPERIKRCPQDRPLTRGVRQLIAQNDARLNNVLKYERLVNVVRLMAASILVAALGILFYGAAISPGLVRQAPLRPAGQSPQPRLAVAMPDEQGLLTLASLNLHTACLPSSHRPRSADHAAALFADMTDGSLDLLHCCTECHHAGQAEHSSMRLVARVQQHCHLCHRG
jgi:hypothetical protein